MGGVYNAVNLALYYYAGNNPDRGGRRPGNGVPAPSRPPDQDHYIEITARYTHVQTEGLKRMFKIYHPRENELGREVNDDYRAAAAGLKAELLRRWQALLSGQGD